ncbi:diguanylate cyclase domain-containing protein [Candidatus Planktophila versatilis]|uniref:diguanylate cyclase domain-containing protein n=1 Tax=Candidatus Planktophila versatilis TaxID=1884905 RepID=UPI001681AAF9|nr:diguanylate cyclase [Candidatus Planktophila versatilis]
MRRELGTAERNKSELSLIRFLISKNVAGIQITESGVESENSQYEVAILSFAEILKASIRSEDLCARLGQLEFTLILKGSSEIATSLAERVLRSWMFEGFGSHYSVLTVNRGESSLEILNRLDNQELRLVTKGY